MDSEGILAVPSNGQAYVGVSERYIRSTNCGKKPLEHRQENYRFSNRWRGGGRRKEGGGKAGRG